MTRSDAARIDSVESEAPADADVSRAPSQASQSYTRRVVRQYRKNRRGMIGLVCVVLLMVIAFFSPLLAARQPIVCRYQGRLFFPAVVEVFQNIPLVPYVLTKAKPFNLPGFNAKAELDPLDFAIWPLIPYGPLETTPRVLHPPSAEHWLGTDSIGRDIAARMVYGTIVSVKVGIVSMGIAAIIGIAIGAVAGYFGGWVDALVSRVIEVVICFPIFFLILSVMIWLEPNILNVMIVIGLTRWTAIARYTRGEFMRLKTLDYVTAARAVGVGPVRIMFRHLLPNSLAPVLVTVTFGIASAILIEAGLSWLGFGVQPPQPSWGNILRSAYEHLRIASYMVYPPCVAIFCAVLVYNLVGDALRDAIDPRIHQQA
ncbi:MAG: ABC transporter permease [Planctomycetes bacterium]|nr:ABC transporter permease [Planctomycetota bacterium]